MLDRFYINEEISKYWSYIKNANDEIKLNLISLLSLSIANKNRNVLEEHDMKTANFLKKYSGAWHGKETAEEIIEIINSHHSSKEPPLFD